jgi:hypothetical protein
MLYGCGDGVRPWPSYGRGEAALECALPAPIITRCGGGGGGGEEQISGCGMGEGDLDGPRETGLCCQSTVDGGLCELYGCSSGFGGGAGEVAGGVDTGVCAPGVAAFL